MALPAGGGAFPGEPPDGGLAPPGGVAGDPFAGGAATPGGPAGDPGVAGLPGEPPSEGGVGD